MDYDLHELLVARFNTLDLAIAGLSTALTNLGAKMSAELDSLVAEVEVVKGVEQSATALILGFAAQLQTIIDELNAQKIDTAKLVSLHDDLVANTQPLADAVAANPSNP